MEGFYYDGEIEHIVEIVKNSLYFAVLDGEQGKILKNTHDTYYFSIDDELVYVNYYFDFGPLNISCLYKYCRKLSNYLQCAQGVKRVVHYTTSNPSKRVNAAFLIGSYSVMYLKMSPKDIYHILISTGGPFKSFVDASQGISQNTIRLLDCLNAIQKAVSFNFFDFSDFDVKEYDTHDKLQNGDMNWLLPRKFLAFIGPTDSEILNAHPPEFYIKYFIENDVKTVVRLNNKLYNPSVFTQSGIDHHELFFPDGSVPPKQILLQFLELSEKARAAVAVHCKAGLGRTGSLIGAYLIKHYKLTARESIAWMRICRPGSVIGQQQGWLEKIEMWLWKQGNQYRLQHFGEGDKIPHHKYGIYSKEWIKEREKVMRQFQRRRLENQFLKPKQVVGAPPRRDSLGLPDNLLRSSINTKRSNLVKLPKQLTVFDKEDQNKRITKLLDKIHSVEYNGTQYFTGGNTRSKTLITNSKTKEEHKIDRRDQAKCSGSSKQKSYEAYEGRMLRGKSRRRNQSEGRDALMQSKPGDRIRKQFVENLEQTQGDKLNAIKAQKQVFENNDNAGNSKPGKGRRRLSSADVVCKTKASTSKKQETEAASLKRLHYEYHQMYPSRS